MITFINMLSQMAPYLLLGFLMAGLLHVFVPANFFERHLSKENFKSVLLAGLIGIPLPLCSCGVIPTAISLRKDGASRGAIVAFMISTPQIGVDSIIATYSMMGLPFAIVRPNQVIYRIEGMSCNHCKNSVEKAIRGLENVENVEVVLGKKEAVVTGKPSDEDVKKAVEELGFEFKGRK